MRETFLRAAGPLLVKRIVEILEPRGIPVMPLKGVLLQKLVYGDRTFRPIVDVDLLVPDARFFEAYALLRANGFTQERWEPGEWQVTLKNPRGVPLGIDLHRRLTRTSRARLTPAAMFARGTRDTGLFDAPVVLPSNEDLLAHLLLHATLHWIKRGNLHRPGDFEALASVRVMDAGRCARHLREQGMIAHASLMLPMIAAQTKGPLVPALLQQLDCGPRGRIVVGFIRALTRRFPPGAPARRLAGATLAPSISGAVLDALRDRTSANGPTSSTRTR